MKKIITIIATAIFACACASLASAQIRKDVVITPDQAHLDASFKQFKKASKSNQIEILNYLVDCANEAYLDCKTIEDLYDVKEQMNVIKFYNSHAKQNSITIVNAIRKLDNKITQTEAAYKKAKVIDRGTATYYQDYGQELD